MLKDVLELTPSYMATKKKETTTVEATTKRKTKKTAPKVSTVAKKTSKAKEARFSPKAIYSAIRKNISNNRTLYTRYLAITLLVITLGAFLFFKKNWFVAAVVNNQPITTVEYYQNLKAKDNKEILNQIVRDKLITQEANKNGIVISQQDLDKKTGEIEKQLGGKDQLKQALESRNISEEEFKNQIRIQLLVEKLLKDQIKVEDKEIDEYIANNKDNTSLGVDIKDRNAVKDQLQNEKLNDKFQSWYDNLQKKAKIYILI